MSAVVDIHVNKKTKLRRYYDVYIGRAVRYTEFTKDSKWRNRNPTLEAYEKWVRDNLWEDLLELEGKILGCWCVNTKKLEPLVCHGQILMKLVRERKTKLMHEKCKHRYKNGNCKLLYKKLKRTHSCIMVCNDYEERLEK